MNIEDLTIIFSILDFGYVAFWLTASKKKIIPATKNT